MISKSREISRASLNSIPVPVRPETKYWKGINHGVLANAIIDEIQNRSLTILSEQWSVSSKNQTILWGSIDLAIDFDIGQSATFSIGVRHGNLSQYALSFAVGARVCVCDNGMFYGDYVMKRRHTINTDMHKHIGLAIDQCVQQCDNIEHLINRWRSIEIDDRDAAYLMMKAHSEGCVCFTKLEDVKTYWTSPVHEEFEPRTVWSLYNAFTEMARDHLSPPNQYRLMNGLRKMFNEEFFIEN
jgi:hypothetical protein